MDDPKFMLVIKGSQYYTNIKKDSVKVGVLLGSPEAWAQHDDENTSFRQCTARIRLQEMRYVRERRKLINHNVPVNIGDDVIMKRLKNSNTLVPKTEIFITLVLSKDQKKKVKASVEETADSFLEKNWKYFPISREGNQWRDYVLKVVGSDEYFIGPHKMSEFEYIQRAESTNTETKVAPILRKEVEVERTDSYIYEREEEFLSTDPVIRYDHAELSKALNGGNELIQSMNLLSVWDLTTEFKVRIAGLDSLPLSLPFKTTYISVSLTVYCGDQPICAPQETVAIPIKEGDTTVQFPESPLCTGIRLSDLPRDTKLCFSVLFNKKGKKEKQPHSWLNCLIYNYKNELRTGKFNLKMWPGASSPIGTVVANTSDKATIIKLEFGEYKDKTVVFPTEPLEYPAYFDEGVPSSTQVTALQEIISRHSLAELSTEDKALLWKYRLSFCIKHPQALPKYLMSVPKTDRNAIQEMHKLIPEWAPIQPVDALELLDVRYADAHIRTYAVQQLEKLVNAKVEDYLLQLVQVLKYENYHDCALSRFLLKRAIRNRRVGHFLYWFLKSELGNDQVSERFGLLLAAFLKGGSEATDSISMQEKVQSTLEKIARDVKEVKNDPISFLKNEVSTLNKNWPGRVQLMLDPGYITSGIKIEKCKVMDSKMKPLWLLFENADPLGDNMYVIYKCGDDLRQDMLTLQMFRIMDKMWKAEEGLDLMLNPYNVIATGKETGLVEVVTKSQTLSKIQKEKGAVMGAFDDYVLAKWLKQVNPDEVLYKQAVLNFTASCAGYCVATYILGIGDRHNDNIMVKEDGHLFHIDFGHILGNFKKKYGIKRERVPFVFTPDWACVMGEANYKEFIKYCIRAHDLLSQNYNLFINLFSMMLISGMPELQTKADLLFLVETLSVMDKGQRYNFGDLIEATGSQVSTRLNWMIHNIAHW
uniref:phosphatidylinositol 3-kinase n=1 Tax=Arcella intermedia TaxID=1963864 RepID=A0A6B2KX87_9EUKA